MDPYKMASMETKADREKRMMERKLCDIYIPLKAIQNDLLYKGNTPGRRYVFLEGDGLNQWKLFFSWMFSKYGKMFRNRNLKVFSLVGTIRKQRNKLFKEIGDKRQQVSMFPEDTEKEVDELLEEVCWINILEMVLYEDINHFFEFFYHS